MPGQIILTVNAAFAIEKNAKSGSGSAIELLFDSTAQPLPEGARAGVVTGRQLLYRVGSVYIDMELDQKANSEQASLAGQLLDSAKPGHPMAGIRVSVLERGRSVTRTASNENGEFHLEFDAKRDLKLALSVDGRRSVHLPITDLKPPFDRAAPAKRKEASAGAGGDNRVTLSCEPIE